MSNDELSNDELRQYIADTVGSMAAVPRRRVLTAVDVIIRRHGNAEARVEAARAQTAELNDLIHAVSLELAIVGNWARRLLLVIDGNPHGKDTLSYLADRLRKHVGVSSNGLNDIRNRWWDELTAANARAADLAAENESLRARIAELEAALDAEFSATTR